MSAKPGQVKRHFFLQHPVVFMRCLFDMVIITLRGKCAGSECGQPVWETPGIYFGSRKGRS
jgi:hypothetical protein